MVVRVICENNVLIIPQGKDAENFMESFMQIVAWESKDIFFDLKFTTKVGVVNCLFQNVLC